MTEPIEISKGSREKLLVGTWTKDEKTYVTVSLQRDIDGEFIFLKWGFGLRADEARELARALVRVAEEVEGESSSPGGPRG